MRRHRTAIWLAGAMMPAAAVAQTADPPTIDCVLGFEALRLAAQALPAAERREDSGFEVVSVAQPDTWRVEYGFTTSWHPAHPSVTLRTFRKQVTGVWTAESKSCGYGDRGQFAALVENMKTGDKELTDASRADVERSKQSRSPLAPPH